MQYFLDDFGNFENFVKIWTHRPPNYYKNASKNTRKYGITLGNIIYVNMGLNKMNIFDKMYVLGTMFFVFCLLGVCFCFPNILYITMSIYFVKYFCGDEDRE